MLMDAAEDQLPPPPKKILLAPSAEEAGLSDYISGVNFDLEDIPNFSDSNLVSVTCVTLMC